jgi:hypothetical protein
LIVSGFSTNAWRRARTVAEQTMAEVRDAVKLRP